VRLPSPSLSRAVIALAALAALAVLAIAGRVAEPARAIPTELFFSEYVEGSGNNKALELYNGTGAAVTLTGVYDVQIFANGSATATATVPLTGTVADGDVFVLARSTAVAAILAQADQTTTNFLYNGNDAVALRNAGVVVDVIGQIGVDPGAEWGTGGTTTLDHTLRRGSAVQAGDSNGGNAFDPSLEWNGFPIDSFDGLGGHSVSGGGGGSNRAPTAGDDIASLDEDAGETTIDVLANDTDADGDLLSVSAVSDPPNGTAEAGPAGTIVYDPAVDFHGTDSLTYTVSDGRGGFDTATVSITVTPVNDDPDPEDDPASVAEDGQATIPVLGNDEDVDGDTLLVASVEAPLHGTAEVSQDGTTVVYTPAPDFAGEDSLEYTVSDGNGGTDSAEILVTVAPVNDPPRPASDVVTVPENGNVVIDVLANDAPGPVDEAGQSLGVTAVSAPGHGSAELISSGPDAGKIRYTPAAGYRGADSFTYDVSDGGATATGTVNVTVRASSPRTICGLAATILGTMGDDVLTGTAGDDVIRARKGNDVIDGNGGNDVICGGAGADRITAGDGGDRIAGGTGPDSIVSGAGSDTVRGGFGSDSIGTGEGADRAVAGPGADSVDAGDGRNNVSGGAGDDSLTAGAGNDRLDGGAGTDACDADGGRNVVLRCE
jgi:Ca2+-binding RTX toxin-like protein